MKSIWPITSIAAIPVIALVMALQSCGGVGGAAADTSGTASSVTQEFLALLSTDQRSSEYIGNDACSTAACHGSAADPVKDHFDLTKHAEKGVTCEKCHGPGGAHQASPTKPTSSLCLDRVHQSCVPNVTAQLTISISSPSTSAMSIRRYLVQPPARTLPRLLVVSLAIAGSSEQPFMIEERMWATSPMLS